MDNKKQQLFSQLVITRPAGQAKSLLARLNQVVDDSITLKHLPLIQIVPLDFSLPQARDIYGMIFISGNAARFFYAGVNPTDTYRNVRILAVGDNTAAEVERLSGHNVLFPQQMNSEGLLQLPQLKSITGQHWLIIKGEGGRPAIYQNLAQRGAQVTEIDVYRRKLPDFNTQQQIFRTQLKQPLWIITSAEALTNLHRILGLANNPGHNTDVIVSSDRLAALAAQKGFAIIAQSTGASELQLVECIKALSTNRDRE